MSNKPGAVLVGCVLALLIAIALGVSFGTDPVSVVTAVVDPASRDHDIVFEVRLPRVLLAALAGAGLSIVGVALQALLRNPLAEPFVLGVSGGSAFGATIAILYGLTQVGGFDEDPYENNKRERRGQNYAIAGIVGLVGFRIWEVVDAWAAPPLHNRKVRALKRQLGLAPPVYGVYLAPPQSSSASGGVAGLSLSFMISC